MLVSFSISNYRSFRDRVTLRMEAAKRTSHASSRDEPHIVAAGRDLRLLTNAVVYGANASGKSNLVAAIDVMRTLIVHSSRDHGARGRIDVAPFRLNTATETAPSQFEITVLIDGAHYRYGFAVHRRDIVGEWLYQIGNVREATLFVRDRHAIRVNPRTFREGRHLESRTPPDALFLSVVAQFNGAIALRLAEWFETLNVTTGVTDWSAMARACAGFASSPHRRTIESLFRRLDVGIERLDIERFPLKGDAHHGKGCNERFPGAPGAPFRINAFHQRFDATGRPEDCVAFSLDRHESAGVQRLFALALPIVRALKEGGALVIDEVDACLHPHLARALIRLFDDPIANPHHAQLIATILSPHLLRAGLFQRDQVWFVTKSRQGASGLISLADDRANDAIASNDASFEKDDPLERYGGIPGLADLHGLLGESHGAARPRR